MIRRRYGTSLSRAVTQEEEVNPNAYLTNIADCMMVLVLGFLVAIVARYGLDLQAPVEEEEEDKITGIEVNLDQNGDGTIDDDYKQTGTVYYDEKTGLYYLVQDE